MTTLSSNLTCLFLCLATACADRALVHNTYDSGISTSPDASAQRQPACTAIKTAIECTARPDCITDLCTVCSCIPTFMGCRTASEPITQCPAVGCLQAACCHADRECSPFATCVTDQFSPPFRCGACEIVPGDCNSDTDCKGRPAGPVCLPAICGCNQGNKSCQPGCQADTDCAEPEICTADHHCRARLCSESCAGNYMCGPDHKTCTKRTCTSDTNCSTLGACVNGQCSRGLGQCTVVEG